MPRVQNRMQALRVLAVLVPAFAACRHVIAQPPSLDPTRAVLTSLQDCLGTEDSALKDLRQGLVWGWNNKSHTPPPPGHAIPPPPAEYLESLDRDLKACSAAMQLNDRAQQQAVLAAVHKDIALKAADCHRFGMGRNVDVKVSTLRGAAAENGWTVYYRWICSSAFQPDEMRAARLTSPAWLQIPPGEYSFRAERKASGARVESAGPARIVVGGAPSTDIELPIE